jgi:predicted transcriptional regulator
VLIGRVGYDREKRERRVPEGEEIKETEKAIKSLLNEIENLKTSNKDQEKVKLLLKQVCKHLQDALGVKKKYSLERKIAPADEPELIHNYNKASLALDEAEKIAYKEAGLCD